MKISKATKKNLELFREWGQATRIEERTCRPVKNGKHVPRTDRVLRLAYFIVGHKAPVGKFDVFDFNPRNRSAEFGIMVDPKMRGKGIGTRMVSDCLDYVFKTTDLNKLYGQTGAFNKASIVLLKKLGFHRDAVLREHHELDGELHDDYIFSVLRRDWMKGKSKGTSRVRTSPA
jgi:ribosomal-protein-alanine N-acetyltransferase